MYVIADSIDATYKMVADAKKLVNVIVVRTTPQNAIITPIHDTIIIETEEQLKLLKSKFEFDNYHVHEWTIKAIKEGSLRL